MACLPERGEFIPLRDKQKPTCEVPIANRSPPYAVLLGGIDGDMEGRAESLLTEEISAIRLLLETKGESVWDEAYHHRNNVKLIRPSHDKWGVKKAVFVFCDDFLKRVYHFPWFQPGTEWAAVLNCILSKLGIPRRKVVRMIFACMPPGMVIPVHHDTGLWVQRTHRVHVPIISNEAVKFFVGADEASMKPVLFQVGCAIELNNQAKHAVENWWDQDRVHLIFDYVEEDPPEIVMLEPGTQLAQTRRSIDVIQESAGRKKCGQNKNKNSQTLPQFIVLGAQKCGTTSVFESLCKHPLVVRGCRRETHFFDWRWPSQLTDVESQVSLAHHCCSVIPPKLPSTLTPPIDRRQHTIRFFLINKYWPVTLASSRVKARPRTYFTLT